MAARSAGGSPVSTPDLPEPPRAVDSDGDGIPDLKTRARRSRRTVTTSTTKTDVPTPTTIPTASRTWGTSARTNPRRITASRTRTAAPTRVRPRPPRLPTNPIKEGPIAFDENSAVVRGETAAILDSIAAFIRDRPGRSTESRSKVTPKRTSVTPRALRRPGQGGATLSRSSAACRLA